MKPPPRTRPRGRPPSGPVGFAPWLAAAWLAAAAPARAQDPPAGDADAAGAEEPPARVYRFGAIDVTGELRRVRLLFFLDRLRAEFDRPRLPHRSFLPELVEAAGAREVFE